MRKYYAAIIFLSLTWSCTNNNTEEIRNDFKKYYDQYQVEGSFVLYDLNKEKYIFYNKSQFENEYSPASTFKICNSLIGLETGVISDENFTIQWDSVHRNEIWDRDFDLKDAFKNSAVWYYQEMARRVGGERMNYWLKKAGYGNADTSGGIDHFWLEGGLRITPEQQIGFLRKLYFESLPFSKRAMEITKKIMILQQDSDFILRGKTGWGFDDIKNIDIGWFVGYVEVNKNVYFFVNCVQKSFVNPDDIDEINLFNDSRKAIAYSVLRDIKIIE